jgi:4-amino-4-deoxy-L-arabinose transferase-like glycosyltransferase
MKYLRENPQRVYIATFIILGLLLLIPAVSISPTFAARYLSADHNVTVSGVEKLKTYKDMLAFWGIFFIACGFTLVFLKNIIDKLWEKALVVLGTLVVLLPTSPLGLATAIDRDAGAFLYIGWRILNGELPYLNIWDHKPPFVYYIDAFGLAISNNSRWGVWQIEFTALLVAAVLAYWLVKRSFGRIPAVLGTALWLLTLAFVIQGGNLTEEYALPLQFATLLLISDFERLDFRKLLFVLIGALGAIAFFTKQTTIGVWLSFILYLTISRLVKRQASQWAREILLIVAGGLGVVILVGVFFGVQGALPQFWNEAFAYNLIYSSSVFGFTSRFLSLLSGVKPLVSSGLFQIAMVGYIFTVVLVLARRSVFGKWLPLLIIGLIDLPIELVMVSISGNTFPHYFISVLPVLALFAGVTFWAFIAQVSKWKLKNAGRGIIVSALMVIFIWNSASGYREVVIGYQSPYNRAVIRYVTNNTTPGDYVLVWGAEATVNFFSLRRSPTSFVYQFPLYKQGYVNQQMVEGYLRDIIDNRPELIIDSQNPETPFLDLPVHSPEIDADIAYLASSYQFIKQISTWNIYEYAGESR